MRESTRGDVYGGLYGGGGVGVRVVLRRVV